MEIDLATVRDICISNSGRYKLVGYSHGFKTISILGDDIELDLNYRTIYCKGKAPIVVSGKRIHVLNGTIRANLKGLERGAVIYAHDLHNSVVENLKIYYSYNHPPAPANDETLFAGVWIKSGVDVLCNKVHVLVTRVAHANEPPTRCPCET